MPSTPAFAITFINSDNTKDDSKLTIQPSNNGSFVWTFKDKDLKNTHVATYSLKEAVTARLDNMMQLVLLDDCPVRSLQIDSPGYPVVLINHHNIDRAKYFIQQAFNMAAANWPVYSRQNCSGCNATTAPRVTVPPPPVPAPRAPHADDYPSSIAYNTPLPSEERWESDDDVSMPPLVSINGYNRHWRYY
jgi:hypothetical protein